MKLTIGFSPCPNDTFIFDALVNKKIDTGNFEFDPVTADVETLNEWAATGKLDITKLSFPAFFRSLDHYTLLNAGGALGNGVGPLLISDTAVELSEDDITQASIALPGVLTTANFLFSYAYPGATNKQFMLFSNIEDALLEKTTDLGVIIHESRFTYSEKGLHKVRDLGEFWEERTKMPIPLGGIVINQSIKRSTALQIENLLRESIRYAFANLPELPAYVRENSQEMKEEVMRQHIDLYVNDYSLDYGEKGRAAITYMHQVFLELNDMEADDEDVLFL